jgi:hypothetical protein
MREGGIVFGKIALGRIKPLLTKLANQTPVAQLSATRNNAEFLRRLYAIL